MQKRKSIIAHIPARGGSKRVPMKNLRLLNGKPMLGYVIEAALDCEALDEIYVNTDSDRIENYAKSIGMQVYKRNPALATDIATSDEFNFDIINTLQPAVCVMLNPVCPLIKPASITSALKAFMASDADTLITSSSTQMQAFFENKPININTSEPLRPSQENTAVQICNWAITIWNGPAFIERMNRTGFAVFGENRILHDIDHLEATKVSNEEDFRLCDAFMQSKESSTENAKPQFWSETI